MKISVIYSNSIKANSFVEDVGTITVLLQKFGDVLSISTGFGLLVFTLETSRRCEEVKQALNELSLKGNFTVNQAEEEDVDQYCQ